MIVGVADTHAALWYLFADSRLSAVAKQFIDNAVLFHQQVAISAVSLAEVVYLVEKGRLPPEAYSDFRQCLTDPLHVFTEVAFTVAIVDSMKRIARSSVPDMPDRMIAATAVYFAVPVISRDRRILSGDLKTIW